MKHKLLLTAALAALTATQAAAQTNVQPYQPGITPAGITYFLPKTAFRFVVTATRTTRHPGPFAQYAERFLGITDVITTDTDTWTLDGITAVPYSTPDVSEAYTIELNPKSAAPLVTLTPDGILLAINDEAEFAPVLPMASSTIIPVDNPDASDFYSEDFLRAGSMVKKAETVAEEIYDIREKRTLIANGEADFNPTDGQQLQLMLERQDAKEAALKTLFTGTTSKRSYTYVIDYAPNEGSREFTLFRFSKHLGLVDPDDMSGEPYCLRITDETVRPEVDPTIVPAKAKKPLPDVRYRIPGRARIVIADTKSTVFEQNYYVAQFGHVERLSVDLFNKRFTTHVKFSPLTGNIAHIDMAEPTK